MAGALLACIYGRCGWSDIANLHSCDTQDKNFLELTVVVDKASVTVVRNGSDRSLLV